VIAPGVLEGMKILVVEDEFIVALELSRMIRQLGGEVLGPVSSVAEATRLSQTPELDGAMMDIRLGRESSISLAEDLLARGVAVVLTTGYAENMLPDNLAHAPRLSKPYTRDAFQEVASKHFRHR
jgi:DNA-binding LytR/AlgR family response regulator